MKIIGFTGKMGVGKSTAVGLLREIQDSQVCLVKFAQPLYDIQKFIYDRISSVHTLDPTFIKDRKLLQWLGTDWGRDTISDTLWVDLWKQKVLDTYEVNTNSLIVCDDVRFNNEAAILKELGALIVEIKSEDTANRIDTKSGITSHASENGLDARNITCSIINNGTIEDLKSSLRRVLEIL